MSSSIKFVMLILIVGLLLSGCGTVLSGAMDATATIQIFETRVASPSPFINTTTPTSTPTVLPSETIEPTRTATQTSTLTVLPTQTPTPVPTYVNLRGKVIVEQANCRYGPGHPYLYKYALIGGSNLEIIGRNERGSWIQIRAIGGTNPCWVKADLMEIKGNVMDVQPIHPDDAGLPWSPYYGPLKGVSAQRRGSEVTVSWSPLHLRAGDDSEQFPYLVEAWVCREGQLEFTPVGSYETALVIEDEPGCSEPSHGRVYGVEKHGYTLWVKVPWPQP